MGMTLTEKIIARHANKEWVEPGQIVEAEVDLALANDITAPLAIEVFEELGAQKVWDKDKIALVPDHFVPNKDIGSAEQVRRVREFAHRHNITHFFELGDVGVEHILLPEKGLVLPGELVIGADSHTCTYGALGAFSTGVGSTDLGVIMATGRIWLKVPKTIKLEYLGELRPYVGGKDLILKTLSILGVDGANYCALYFTGPVVASLEMADRFTMANMAVEAGAKNGIFDVDEKTLSYLNGRALRPFEILKDDPDALYWHIHRIFVSDLEPQVALPHSPANVMPVGELTGIKIDQAFIGSCTNGRLEDLRAAAKILEGEKIARHTRLIIIPGTPWIYAQAIKEGLIQTFLAAGAVIGPPCCGPCLGGHMGILAKGEVAISTSNRNFLGRMGHAESKVYLSNPYVAAASAVAGEIVHPRLVKGA